MEDIKDRCIAASERAQELRRISKLQEARILVGLCMDAACPGPVMEDCTRLLVDVDAAMPTIVLAAQDAAGNDLSTVRVTMDGQPFVDKLDGKPLSLNPGVHHFVFESPGLPSVEKSWVVSQGEKDRRERVVLGNALPIAVAAPVPASVLPPSQLQIDTGPLSPAASTSTSPQPMAPVAQPANMGMRLSAETTVPMQGSASKSGAPAGVFIAGGIGVSGLLTGAVTGVLALSKASSLNAECPHGNTSCPSSAQRDISDLRTMETATNIALGIGIGGVVIASIWWLASGHSEKASRLPMAAWMGAGSAGVGGSF